eukprot:3941237-Rhodomonas_salina.2
MIRYKLYLNASKSVTKSDIWRTWVAQARAGMAYAHRATRIVLQCPRRIMLRTPYAASSNDVGCAGTRQFKAPSAGGEGLRWQGSTLRYGPSNLGYETRTLRYGPTLPHYALPSTQCYRPMLSCYAVGLRNT